MGDHTRRRARAGLNAFIYSLVLLGGSTGAAYGDDWSCERLLLPYQSGSAAADAAIVRPVGPENLGLRLTTGLILGDSVLLIQDNAAVGVDELFLADLKSGKLKAIKSLTWYGDRRITARDIRVDGRLAYLSTGSDGVMAMDLFHFGHGPLRLIRPRHFAWSVAVERQGNQEIGYIAEAEAGVSVVNVETGVHLGVIRVPGAPRRIELMHGAGRRFVFTETLQGVAKTDVASGATEVLSAGTDGKVLDFALDSEGQRVFMLVQDRAGSVRVVAHDGSVETLARVQIGDGKIPVRIFYQNGCLFLLNENQLMLLRRIQ